MSASLPGMAIMRRTVPIAVSAHASAGEQNGASAPAMRLALPDIS